VSAADEDADGMSPEDVVDELANYIISISDEFEDIATDAVAQEATPLSQLPVTRRQMQAIAVSHKEWTRYQGPRGGMGWRNTETNEVVYDDDPPGETVDAPGRDTTLDVGGLEPEVVGSQFDDEDLDPPPEDELPDNQVSEATPEEFADSVGDVLASDPSKGAFLAEHPPEELEDHTLLTADEGAAGVAISPSGDIQNLHANDDAPSGTGEKLLREAVANGGRTLDNYDTFLTRLYARNGFREVSRMDFNAEFAPDEWDYDEYGYPDVVFMGYDPDSEYERTDEYITADEWGEAKEQSLDRADSVTESEAAMTQQQEDNDGGYDAAAEIQKFIDEAVENRGEEAVARNIDSLLAGLGPVMQVPDKSELDIPSVEESDGEE